MLLHIATQHTLNQPLALHIVQVVLIQQKQDVVPPPILLKIFIKEQTQYRYVRNAVVHVKKHILLANVVLQVQQRPLAAQHVITQAQLHSLAHLEEPCLEVLVR